jgi:hypothetical protein
MLRARASAGAGAAEAPRPDALRRRLAARGAFVLLGLPPHFQTMTIGVVILVARTVTPRSLRSITAGAMGTGRPSSRVGGLAGAIV